jgi:hypothetical protein
VNGIILELSCFKGNSSTNIKDGETILREIGMKYGTCYEKLCKEMVVYSEERRMVAGD